MMKWLVGFRVLLVGLPGLAVLWNVSICLIEWGSDLDKLVWLLGAVGFRVQGSVGWVGWFGCPLKCRCFSKLDELRKMLKQSNILIF